VSGFTGERLVAEDADFGVDLARHLAAYRHARGRASGRTVLDAGCGEGYGAAILAEVALRVLGVDRTDAIALASARHAGPRIEFRAHDLTRLDQLPERFGLVLSFQVIEHLEDPVAFLRGLAGRMAAGGTLLVTTPNRLMSVSENPYHLREWTAPELLALASPVLPSARVLGIHGSERVRAWERARKVQVDRLLRLDVLGLRRLLPRRIVLELFPRLARLVRRRLRQESAHAPGPDDFTVDAARLDEALDLLLVAGES
jgi:2-polyprenyl-3-methyl-5-hydroxy-6-metoxy-1,4-benzoquinol methylase